MWLAVCVIVAGPHARAQEPSNIFAPHLYPMMIFDEATIRESGYVAAPYPAEPWARAKACFRLLGGRVPADSAPPTLIVIPARSLRVRDLLRDSLFDKSLGYEKITQPGAIAYSFLRSNVVLVVTRYQASPSVLRHEAMHFLVWRAEQLYGHPPQYFDVCG